MKILIVSSGNAGRLAPFVKEQIDSLKNYNLNFEYFFINGKGIIGYFSNLASLKLKIRAENPDIIHAHYGLSGLLSLLAFSGKPVITTFHGNDINPINSPNIGKPSFNRILSRFTHQFSRFSIFVNKDLASQINAKVNKSAIIPCHVDIELFYPMKKTEARKSLNLSMSKGIILFSSSFDIKVKNSSLAKAACQSFPLMELIELKGYSRQMVNLLLNACDVALITSLNEGSSQFLKEAMACNCPLISTRVGDAELVFGETKGCFLTTFEIKDVVNKISMALAFRQKYEQTKGRQRILELELDAEHTSMKIFEVYKKTLNNVRYLRNS